MPRASRSQAKRARHKKWLKRAKGFRGRRRTVFKLAKEAVIKAGQYAYRDRRRKKADFRASWQIAINAAVRTHGLSYSQFVFGLRQNNIALNRKVLAQLAITKPAVFKSVVESVKTEKK